MSESFAIYIIIGILSGFFFYYVLRKHTLGGIYGAVLIGVIGSILGGSLLNEIVDMVYVFFKEFNVNIIATLIGSSLFIWVFNLVSPSSHSDKE